MSKIRLQSALAKAGVAARRKAAEIILSGRVKVNGAPVNEKGFRVDVSGDKITFDGKPVVFENFFYYYILNKPIGIISASSDVRGRKTVFDCVDAHGARVYPVGRLDKDTTGLIILTNDGELTYRMTHPKFGIDRVYEVRVKGAIKAEDFETLKKGVLLDGKLARPVNASLKSKTKNYTVAIITLSEGRKREVRNMFKFIGYPVKTLKRLKYGPLTLGHLEEGEYRALTAQEIAKLKKSVKIS